MDENDLVMDLVQTCVNHDQSCQSTSQQINQSMNQCKKMVTHFLQENHNFVNFS